MSLYPDFQDSRVFACELCQDMKFLYPRVGGKVDYSTTVPCPKCTSWSPEDRQRWLELAGIPRARQEETLANFRDAEGALDAFEAAYALGYGFYENEQGKHETPWRVLLIYGGHGNGKTHLSRGAMMAAGERGVRGRYYTVRRLMADLREAMDAKVTTRSADAIINTVKQVPFLVLDELGTEDPRSDWQAGVLEDIINHRYDAGLSTFLIANKDIKELPPAILSRLQDESMCRCVWNQAPDYRLQKGGAQ